MIYNKKQNIIKLLENVFYEKNDLIPKSLTGYSSKSNFVELSNNYAQADCQNIKTI